MKVRLVVIEDHSLFRGLLVSRLRTDAGIEVLGEADNGIEGVRVALETKPDVVLMDIQMPGMNGIEATRRILGELPGTAVLALSACNQESSVSKMMDAGAKGFVDKSCSEDFLVHGIQDVAEGGMFFSCTAGEVINAEGAESDRPKMGGMVSRLSPREQDVFLSIGRQKSTKTIAGELGVTESTVYTHKRRIMEKLGLKRMEELNCVAVRMTLYA